MSYFPICILKLCTKVINHQSSIINHQSSINHQSIIHQSSINLSINHQISIINHQSSIIKNQSSSSSSKTSINRQSNSSSSSLIESFFLIFLSFSSIFNSKTKRKRQKQTEKSDNKYHISSLNDNHWSESCNLHHQLENAPTTTTNKTQVQAPLPCGVLHNISKKFKKSLQSLQSHSQNPSISLISNLILLLFSSLLFTFFLTQFECPCSRRKFVF